MHTDKQPCKTSTSRFRLSILAVLLMLLCADFVITPHAPVHFLPRTGIYMLITLAGSGLIVGATLLFGKAFRRREDYYER